jgi:orotidine-5'-phosphate decarboxylase
MRGSRQLLSVDSIYVVFIESNAGYGFIFVFCSPTVVLKIKEQIGDVILTRM